MQIQEPSLLSAECSSSTLNPGKTVKESAGVACVALPSVTPPALADVFSRQALIAKASNELSQIRRRGMFIIYGNGLTMFRRWIQHIHGREAAARSFC